MLICKQTWTPIVLSMCMTLPTVTLAQTSTGPAQGLGEARTPLPLAQLDEGLSIVGEEVRAREVQSRLVVPVSVNGLGPFRFTVDSGADRTVVGRRVAERLALPSREGATLHSMSGASRVATVDVANLTVGSATVRDMRSPVLAERDLGGDGMLGIDALRDQRLMLDFVQRQVIVQDARRPARVEAGDVVITARRRRGQLILAEGTIDNRRVDAVIDTGSQVTIGNSALRRQLFGKRGPRRASQVEIVSVTGEKILAEFVQIPELRFGKLRVQNASVAFVDVPPFELFGISKRPALLLGTDILGTLRRVSLDFRRRKVRFQTR